jgi:hypothetical protein
MLPGVWGVYAVIAAVVVTPVVVLARKRVRWRAWELLSLMIPFGIWMALMLSGLANGWKSLSNLVVEPAILGLVMMFGALARVGLSAWISERTAAAVTLLGLSLLAAGIFWIVPTLPE